MARRHASRARCRERRDCARRRCGCTRDASARRVSPLRWRGRIAMNAVAHKLCMLGDFGVGKTSLVARFVHSTFSDKYLTTVGVKVDSKEIALPGRAPCKLV